MNEFQKGTYYQESNGRNHQPISDSGNNRRPNSAASQRYQQAKKVTSGSDFGQGKYARQTDSSIEKMKAPITLSLNNLRL